MIDRKARGGWAVSLPLIWIRLGSGRMTDSLWRQAFVQNILGVLQNRYSLPPKQEGNFMFTRRSGQSTWWQRSRKQEDPTKTRLPGVFHSRVSPCSALSSESNAVSVFLTFQRLPLPVHGFSTSVCLSLQFSSCSLPCDLPSLMDLRRDFQSVQIFPCETWSNNF